MSKLKSIERLKVVATHGGKLRLSLTFHHQLYLRTQLYCYFETAAITLSKTPRDLKSVETIMRVALMSEVYAKLLLFNDPMRKKKYTLTVTRAQACAIIISLVSSNISTNIELKAALLKAL